MRILSAKINLENAISGVTHETRVHIENLLEKLEHQPYVYVDDLQEIRARSISRIG